MDKKMETIVKVNVQAAIASVSPTSVNTMAILCKDLVKEQAKKYDSLELLQEDYPNYTTGEGDEAVSNEPEVVSLARSFFAEQNRPDELVVITFINPSSQQNNAKNPYVKALNDAISFDFYGVYTRGLNSSDVEALSDWAAENFRMIFCEYDDFNGAIAAQNSVFNGNKSERVATFYHNEMSKKSLCIALGAVRNSDDPARGTWMFTSPSSIKPDNLTYEQLNQAKSIGLNVYCTIAGTDGCYFGTTGAPTKFIDGTIKKDWVKFRVQEAIYNLLRNSDNGHGLSYDDAGIQAVGAAINGILNEGVKNKYVLDNSIDVSVPTYAEISTAQKQQRNLPNVKGSFSILESIHTVKDVTLYIEI